MTRYDPQPSWERRVVEVSARRLWAGGVATVLVAAGIGVVGVSLVRGVLHVPILSAKGRLVNQAMAVVPISAALAGTALLHLLLLTTPRPTAFFWGDRRDRHRHRGAPGVHRSRRAHDGLITGGVESAARTM